MKLKTDSNIAKSFNAVIAGLLIGLGVIINTQTKPPILGALLFSFGLLTIIHLKLPLYTGKIGYLKDKLVLILVFNLIGIGITVAAYYIANPQFHELIRLIHFAVKCKVSYLTSMAVIIFILIGAEHCIADFPYLLTTLSLPHIGKFLMVILGNSIGAILIEKGISYE